MGAQPGNTLFNQGLFGGPGAAGIPGAITVQNLITQAYRVAFILVRPQRGLSPEELQDGYEVATNLIDQWNAQNLMMVAYPRIVENIQSGQQDYKIGLNAVDPTEGNLVWADVPRPVKIELASTILESNQPTPLELPMTLLTKEQWRDIPLKQTTSTFPLWAYYEPEYPIGIFHVWPVPQQSNQVALYLPQQVSQLPSDPTTQVQFPPGYQKALIYVMARDLCPRWGKVVPPDVEVEAEKALMWVKSVNAPIIDAICDPAVQSDGRGRAWSYITGDWQRR